TGRILAFEPDPFSFGLLQARKMRTGAANVEAYPLALGEVAGQRTLYCSAYNRADNRLHLSHEEPLVEAREVQMRSLDEFLSSPNSPVIDAMKIDVQGAEAQVLRGARTTVRRGL